MRWNLFTFKMAKEKFGFRVEVPFFGLWSPSRWFCNMFPTNPDRWFFSLEAFWWCWLDQVVPINVIHNGSVSVGGRDLFSALGEWIHSSYNVSLRVPSGLRAGVSGADMMRMWQFFFFTKVLKLFGGSCVVQIRIKKNKWHSDKQTAASVWKHKIISLEVQFEPVRTRFWISSQI